MPSVVAPAPSQPALGSFVRARLDRPLSPAWCVTGWLLSAILFVGLAALSGHGGPGTIDSSESIYTTWAVAHGQLACAYPSVTLPHEPLIAPVYPLYSGAVAAIAHIGQSATVPFPSRAAMSPHCDTAIAAIRQWAFRSHSGAFGPTRWIAFSSWLVLMAGVITWLRAVGKGRCGWEPATLLALAALPPLWITVSFYFHPQDLVAMGLALAAMAAARRGHWLGAGVLVALAVLSQQYALLVAAPLLVVAPRERRGRFLVGTAGAAMVIVAPFLVAGSPGILRAIALGSGDTASVGGTMMWFLTHRGPSVVLFSRILPIALALAAAALVSRRLGPVALSPPALGSLVAFCLSLRLLFEQNFFVYYLVALVVALILADVVRGHVRGSLLAWVSSLTMVLCLGDNFLNVTSGLHGQDVLPPLVILTAIGLTVYGMVRGRRWPAWTRLLWSTVVVCAVVTWPLKVNPVLLRAPMWVWQALFVVTGAMLAAGPLYGLMREPRRPTGDATNEAALVTTS